MFDDDAVDDVGDVLESIDDPQWECPTHGKGSTWACVRKHG